MAAHTELGKEGEDIAMNYLVEKGYHIVERNYRYRKAEVDIIAVKGSILVAVEVKMRSSTYFGSPEEFVTSKKIQLLVKAMHHYVVINNLDFEVRFDIVAIVRDKEAYSVKHLEDAFLFF
ncbi:YraN family protein [Tenacibaculum sp. SG-28]|uniref:YraN family protein n=1 Tax=Tenacibaculum sp. SG-28 TaxID=754426 RepID=UPI000CF57F84|nr:YraN family protein [Tenacibaculum sp. SG-28]PQJ21211.1 hypothetical protein BSU00_09520 [Tenacibaculum sp. SG-28]